MRVNKFCRVTLIVAALGVGAAACNAVPQAPDGTTAGNVPPIEKTAVESPLIGAACRFDLAGSSDGVKLINTTDVDLGFWVTQGNPVNEVNNTLDAFRVSALALFPGDTNCNVAPYAP